jgi:hypothetical protein
MAPRYHSNKGNNKYNNGKFFEDVDSPLIIHKDFLSQYKRNMDLTNKSVKPDIGSDIFHKQNENGLQKAYNNTDNYLHKDGDTLYVAGTITPRDYWDDIKIPFGLTRYSQRYQDADKILKQDPDVKNLVSHSLGGAVSLELQKNYPERNYNTITYGAPVNSDKISNERFRKNGDWVSILDSGAQTINKSTPEVGQHSYHGYT